MTLRQSVALPAGGVDLNNQRMTVLSPTFMEALTYSVPPRHIGTLLDRLQLEPRLLSSSPTTALPYALDNIGAFLQRQFHS